ncbi:MAG: integrase catalytic domain-containing protein [Vulcanimicrobiaceae bacterium]
MDEFCAVTGYHRKYAIAADYPWSARLVVIVRDWMPHARVRLNLSDEVAQLLLGMSARSMDRILRPHRTALRRRVYGRTKPGTLLKHCVPVRTERWDTTEVGWCETDTVAHCGEEGGGEFAFSVNLTDVASTWTETRAVLGKSQRFVVQALEDMRRSLPFDLRGIDSDSGSEFVNHHCFKWCQEHHLQFTRGRPYRKNDNAYIEQKNWTHVRKIFGWKRIDAPAAIAAMNELYRSELRVFLNYFQPSVKLLTRRRVGSRVRRTYDAPQTPFERLIALGALSAQQLAAMRAERDALDPFELSAAIETQVRRILSTPGAGTRSRVVQRPAAWAEPLTQQQAAFIAATEAVPVRSNVAR